MNRKLSRDDHVNRLPPLKYSWLEIYSLIFHYLPSPSFLHISGVLEPVQENHAFHLTLVSVRM